MASITSGVQNYYKTKEGEIRKKSAQEAAMTNIEGLGFIPAGMSAEQYAAATGAQTADALYQQDVNRLRQESADVGRAIAAVENQGAFGSSSYAATQEETDVYNQFVNMLGPELVQQIQDNPDFIEGSQGQKQYQFGDQLAGSIYSALNAGLGYQSPQTYQSANTETPTTMVNTANMPVDSYGNPDYSAMIAQIEAANPDASPQELRDQVLPYIQERRRKIEGDEGLAEYMQSQLDLEARYGLGQTADGAMETVYDLPGTTEEGGALGSIYSNILESQLALQEGERAAAVSELEGQIEDVPQTYQDLRSQTDIDVARSIQAQNEAAAAKGLTFTGGVQSDVGATRAAGMEQKALYSREEANVINDLKRAIADVNYAAGQQAIATTADVQAQATTAQMNQEAQEAALAMQEAALTGTYQGQPTMAAQQMAMSAEQWAQTFQYQKDRDAVLDGQWLASFNLNQASTQADANYKAAMLEWSMSPDNPDNVITTLEDTGASEAYVSQYEDIIKLMGETTVTGYDSVGNTLYGPAYTYADLSNIVLSNAALSDQEAIAIDDMLRRAFGETDETISGTDTSSWYQSGNKDD